MSVKKAFSFAELSTVISRDQTDFADCGTVITQGSFEGSTYTFKDNGSNVLGVAHLDTVQQSAYSSLIKVNKSSVIVSPRLDDRLGVYIITRLLPKLGVTCDWLLTTGEEIGCSSAELFRSDKTYNWAFSFDRAGTDCVLYQHDHKALRRILRKAGFHVGQGSFSDLSSLDIGCSGINFGCGYHNPHSLHAYAILNDTLSMVERFTRFYRKYENVTLPYSPRARYQTMTYYRPYSYTPAYPVGDIPAYSHYGRDGYYEYGEIDEHDKAYLDWYMSGHNKSQP